MLTFISSPYSHQDPDTEAMRARLAGDFAAYCWRDRGLIPISPIAHWHDIGRRNRLPGNAMAWVAWNKTLVQKSDMMYVLCLPGWRDSLGVSYEVQFARDAEVPVFYAIPMGGDAYKITSRAPVV